MADLDRRHNRHAFDKLACPTCGGLQSSVLATHQTIAQQQSGGYWRRRRCDSCGHEFDTREDVVEATLPRESL